MGIYSTKDGRKVSGLINIETGKKVKGIISVHNKTSNVIYRSLKITPKEEWSLTIPGLFKDICQFKQDDTIFFASFNGVYKVSPNGVLIKKFKLSGIDTLASSDSGIFAIQHSLGGEVKIVRINPKTGAIIWGLSLPSVGDIKPGKDGSVFVSNISSSHTSSTDVPAIYKISSDGNILWEKAISSCRYIQSFDSDSTGKVFVVAVGAYGVKKIMEISEDGSKAIKTDLPSTSTIYITDNGEFYMSDMFEGLTRISNNNEIKWKTERRTSPEYSISESGIVSLIEYPTWQCLKYDEFGNVMYTYDSKEPSSINASHVLVHSTGFYFTKYVDTNQTQIIKIVEEKGS